MIWRLGSIVKRVMLGVFGAGLRRASVSFSLMKRTVIQVSECQCDGSPCVCSDLEAMLEEASARVISKGFKCGPNNFDVGPGTSLYDGEKLINIYYHKGERDPELLEDPALTVGFTKEGAAKLMYTLLQAARAHGWIDDE